MFVTTLICHPETPNLTTDMVSHVASEIGADKQDWLAQGVAADLYHQDPLNTETMLRDRLKSDAIDIATQRVETRQKKILIADMDSTMIEQECIDEMADVLGVGDQVVDITKRAMNGEMDFETALESRVALFESNPISIIQETLDTRIQYRSGGRELVQTMKAHGGYCALVSGGFTDFTTQVGKTLGFDETRANSLLHSNGLFTGKVGKPILGREAKVTAVSEITKKMGLTAADVLAVGDGANDLGMLKIAGMGVALHAKPIVATESKFQLNFSDLTGLLYLQGYHSDEFKT